jgi:SAM-dependent methyltransferase
MLMKCICGSYKYSPIGYKENHLVVKCTRCGLWYVRDVPDDYLTMYKGNCYHNNHQVNIGHVPYANRYWHDYNIAIARLDKIRTFRPEGRLLDAGCSNGAFVHCALSFGYDAFGIDIANSTNNIKRCHSGDIWQESEDSWEIVTLHDVVEHFLYPKMEIANLRRILRPGGLLVIQSPDFGCDDFIAQGLSWKHVRPIEHIYMMSSTYLTDLLVNQGFKILQRTVPIPGHCTIYGEVLGKS